MQRKFWKKKGIWLSSILNVPKVRFIKIEYIYTHAYTHIFTHIYNIIYVRIDNIYIIIYVSNVR